MCNKDRITFGKFLLSEASAMLEWPKLKFGAPVGATWYGFTGPQWVKQWFNFLFLASNQYIFFLDQNYFICNSCFLRNSLMQWSSYVIAHLAYICSLFNTRWNGSWWHHQMEPFSALLALCVGNSQVTGKSPPQRPVTRSFDVFFDVRLNE